MAIDQVTLYFGERCWRQVGEGVEDFVIRLLPPLVIDIEDEATKGEVGINASVFLGAKRASRQPH